MSLLDGLASSPRALLQSSKARMKKLTKKSQNEKYRLKYLRLRKAAKATVFVSLTRVQPVAAWRPPHKIFPQAVPPSQDDSINIVLAFPYTLLLVSLVSLDKLRDFSVSSSVNELVTTLQNSEY